MNGVEILNQTEIMESVGSCWWVGLILLGFLCFCWTYNGNGIFNKGERQYKTKL